MSPKQAIHILMLSPCYWMLKLKARKQLVKEYSEAYTYTSDKLSKGKISK